MDSDILTVYGGPHATFTAEDTLSHIPWIDVIVRGEGEYTVREIASTVRERKKLRDVLGISYRTENGSIRHNLPRPRIENLDELPLPARDLLPLKRYKQKLKDLDVSATTVITSRGCPVGCSFCAASRMWGKNYARRSPENVAEEVDMLLNNYGFEGIFFFDSTLTLVKRHVDGLCEEFKKRNLDFPWFCEIRVNTVTKKLLHEMNDSGCVYVAYGVESGSQRILDLNNKGITVEQVRATWSWIRELELRSRVFFMFGLPYETISDAMKTVKLINELKGNITELTVSPFVSIYPGTDVERYARDIGCIPKDFSWSVPFKQLDFMAHASVASSRDSPEDVVLTALRDVPILVQPNMSYTELRRMIYEVRKGEIPPLERLKYNLRYISRLRNLRQLMDFGVIIKENCLVK